MRAMVAAAEGFEQRLNQAGATTSNSFRDPVAGCYQLAQRIAGWILAPEEREFRHRNKSNSAHSTGSRLKAPAEQLLRVVGPLLSTFERARLEARNPMFSLLRFLADVGFEIFI